MLFSLYIRIDVMQFKREAHGVSMSAVWLACVGAVHQCSPMCFEVP